MKKIKINEMKINKSFDNTKYQNFYFFIKNY